MRPILAAFLLICLLPVGGQTRDLADVPVTDLTDARERAAELPLISSPASGLDAIYPWTGTLAGSSLLACDIDGDGNDEILASRPEYVQIGAIGPGGTFRVHDQISFPRDFMGRTNPWGNKGSGFTLQGPFDLDGDGRLEVVILGAQEGYRNWRFWIVEVRSEGGRHSLHHEGEFDLASFPERRADDHWDGRYAVLDVLPGLLPDPERLALLIAVNVGYDIEGRGLMAVDPYTGQIIWHFAIGNPPALTETFVSDLDQDGVPEIVFIGRSVGNLHGEEIGGYSDDVTRLFVLDLQGRELWSRQLCGPRSGARLGIVDLDPAEGLELITAGITAGVPSTTLQIWSAAGQPLHGLDLQEGPMIMTVRPGAPSRSADIYLGTDTRNLWQFRYAESKLEPVRRARLASHPVLLKELPVSGHFLISQAGQDFLILDRNLEIQGFVSSATDQPSFFQPVLARGQEYLAAVSQAETTGLKLQANPHALPANPVLRFLATFPALGWALLVIVLLTVFSWWLMARKHRQELQVRAVIPGDGDHLREARLHLLEDLELSGHGAIAPLRSLRRMLWLLDAARTGIEFNQELTARFREIWSDCHEEDLPRLLVILDRARAANLDHPSIDTATDALQKIQVRLAELKRDDFAGESLLGATAELHRHGDTAEQALQVLRAEVSELFCSDLEKVLRKVLRANAEGIARAGVSVHTGLAAAAGGGEDSTGPAENEPARCRMDPAELGFLLDNLVGNAVRAMGGSAQRELRITWLMTNGLVKLTVSDTGLGIADEDRDRLLDTPFTTKESGGGLGLFKSNRLLRKYGGQLSIQSSAPGKGTTFQVMLPRARG